MSERLSDRQLQGFKKAFTIFDKNGNGKITSSDLAIAIKSLGHTVTPDELQAMIQEVDPNNQSQEIEFPTFVSIMVQNTNKSATPSQDGPMPSATQSTRHNKEFIKSMSSSASSTSASSTYSSMVETEEDDEGGDVNRASGTSNDSVVSQQTHQTSSTTATGNGSKKKSKSNLLPSRGTIIWALGLDTDENGGGETEWQLCLLEKVKKPVIIHDRKVVALHVLLLSPPTSTSPSLSPKVNEHEQLQPEEQRRIIHTHFDNAEETEYTLVKKTSLLSVTDTGNNGKKKSSSQNSENGSGKGVVGKPVILSPSLLRQLDLPILSVINDAELLHFLRIRYNTPTLAVAPGSAGGGGGCRFFSIGPLMLAFTVHKRSGSVSLAPRYSNTTLSAIGDEAMQNIPHFANSDVLLDQVPGVGSLAQRMCAELLGPNSSAPPSSSRSQELEGGRGDESRNQVVVLQGESGSGKSTLVRQLSQHVVAALATGGGTAIQDVKINDEVGEVGAV